MRNLRVAIVLLVACLLPSSLAFVGRAVVVTTRTKRRSAVPFARPRTISLADATTTTAAATVEDNFKSDESIFQEQKVRMEVVLQKLGQLKESIEWTPDTEALHALQSEVQRLEDTVYRETVMPLPPAGLSLADYRAAIRTFVRLPFCVRLVYCEALHDIWNDTDAATTRFNNNPYDEPWVAAADFKRVPEIVAAIYENQAQLLVASRIQRAVVAAKARRGRIPPPGVVVTATTTPQASNDTNNNAARNSIKNFQSLFSVDDDSKNNNNNNLLSMDEQQLLEQGYVEALLPQVTRIDGRVATDADLAIALAALTTTTGRTSKVDNSSNSNMDTTVLFAVTDTEAIAGGFVLRGQNRCPTSQELMTALDTKLSGKNWSGTLSYLPDFTNRKTEADFGEDPDPVLLLLHKDMSPTVNPLLSAFTTAAAVATALLFAVGVYAGNDLVTEKLVVGPALNDYSALGWFNVKILQVLWPVFAIQAAHEAGHWAVAVRDKIQTAPPTFLPFWQLPWLGAQTKFKESPPNLVSLFDFASAGPFLGLVISAVFLFVGLQETATASAEAIQYFPSLPVSVLKLWTLGGTVVDNVVNGGNGFLTLQDPTTLVRLHPLAIAGFTGLMIQSFELLPLGATDGGRLSLSLFGRKGHQVIGGVVWGGLLLSSIFVESTDLLVTAWIIYNFVQNDPEIPCRDEVAKVDLGRGAAALALWFAAVLILTPMT